MCEYCENYRDLVSLCGLDEGFKDTFVFIYPVEHGMEITPDKMGIFMHQDSGYLSIETHVEINFCPICGKDFSKLKAPEPKKLDDYITVKLKNGPTIDKAKLGDSDISKRN